MYLKLYLFALVLLLAGFGFAQEAPPTDGSAPAPPGGETPTEATTAFSAPTGGGEAPVNPQPTGGEEAPTQPPIQPSAPGITPTRGFGSHNPLTQATTILNWFSAIVNAIRCITPSQCLFDATVGDQVKTKLQACNAFIELYTEKPVAPKDIDATVKRTFEGKPKNAKAAPKGVDPSILSTTYRCCHVVNGKEYVKENKATGTYASPPLAKGQTCEKVVESLLKAMKQKTGTKA